MKKKIIVLLFILMLVFTSISCNANVSRDNETETEKINESILDKELKIHFIDVGQADCTIIELPNEEEILIDAGNMGDADTIINYLDKLNIEDIEYMILTHPHEDHIGSAIDIIENIDIDNVYMPDVSYNSRLYENTLSSINENNIPVTMASGGLVIIDSPNLKFEVLGPNTMYYSELNEYSVVTKLTYEDTSYLFTGDAESVSELEMIRKGYDLDSDLLKVGHHGGRTSSSRDFIQAVTPKYSIIFSEKGNSYGHPHEETLSKLSSMNSDIYRIDESGTIIATSNGQSISINTSASVITQDSEKASNSSTNNESEKNIQYVGNKNSFVFHDSSCSSVDDMKDSNKVIFSERKEAINQGYKPCGRCNP